MSAYHAPGQGPGPYPGPPVQQQPGPYPGPAARRRRRRRWADLAVVRRRDVLRMRQYGELRGVSANLPYGAPRDPRYPSPRRLRRFLAFLIDVAVHVGGAVAAYESLAWLPEDAYGLAIVAAVMMYIGLSFVHRTFIQRLCHATVGKALTGLYVIRDDTGAPATLGLLTAQWFTGVLYIVLEVIFSP